MIELLVVLIIIGVLMAIVVPSYMSAKRTTRDNTIKQAATSYKLGVEAFRLDHGGRAPVVANNANQHLVDWLPSPTSTFISGPLNASLALSYTTLGKPYMRSQAPEPVTDGMASLCANPGAVGTTPSCAAPAAAYGVIQYHWIGPAGHQYRIDVYTRANSTSAWKHLCSLGNLVPETC